MTLVAVVMIDNGSAILVSHVRDSISCRDTKKCARPAFEIKSDSEAMATGPELFICVSTHQLTQNARQQHDHHDKVDGD